MRAWAGWSIVLVAGVGCQDFEDLEDACKDDPPGDSFGSDESDAFFQRLDCYRRYAGVERARIDKDITKATEAHATYLSLNGVGYDPFSETSGLPGYTGADVFERLRAAEYLVDVASTLVWQVFMPADPSRPRAEMVDLLIHDPGYRDPLLGPGWLGGGYAEGTDLFDGLAYSIWALALPSASHSDKPVLWPVKDQEDVPVSYLGQGYPITLTFGSSLLGSNPDNPLDVIVRSSTITAEDGAVVEHTVQLPGPTYFGDNNSTVVLAPLTILEPETLYTVEVEVEWISSPDGKTIDWSFTTGTEGVSATVFE